MKFIHQKEKEQIFTERIKILIIFLGFILIYLLFYIYNLQINNFKKYYFLSKKNYIRIVPIIPYRGNIFDRNNIPIAINKKYYVIKNIKNNNILKKKIYKNKNKIYFNNFVKYNVYKALLINPKFKKKVYRYYPYKDILAHITGYVKKDYREKENSEKTGIEKYYNNILKGKKGYKKNYINNKGKITNSIKIKKSKIGKNIKLSIDLKLQNFVYNLVKNNNAAIIISNIKNGEILSLISVPSYNPNIFTRKIYKKEYDKIINNKNNPLVNKITQGTYPPASTIKPYIAIAALEEKAIKKNFKIFDPGWWKLPSSNKIFYDWKKQGHGIVNLIKSIEESSDTFYYQVSYYLGINKIIKWIKKFGFGNKTGIDLPNEKKSFLPDKKWKINTLGNKWYLGDTISIGIGQGYLSFTPIQIHKALIILANNGYAIKPHLLLNNKYKKKIYVKNVDKKHWKIIKKGMYGVAHKKNGTAYWNFIGTKYKLAAKSGTAQVYSIGNNKINIKNKNINLKDHILMNVFMPYKKPKIAITIILEHGGNGPRIGEIMRKITDFIKNNNYDK